MGQDSEALSEFAVQPKALESASRTEVDGQSSARWPYVVMMAATMRIVASPADALYLRLIYRRLEAVRRAATTGWQKQQGRVAQHRVTAALVSNGWRVREIADVLGVSRYKIRYWNECGQKLEHAGLSLPSPRRSCKPITVPVGLPWLRLLLAFG